MNEPRAAPKLSSLETSASLLFRGNAMQLAAENARGKLKVRERARKIFINVTRVRVRKCLRCKKEISVRGTIAVKRKMHVEL